jgi:FtsZ-interacting cell division protein ZipA
MAEKEKKTEFVVTDRRLFSTDGELRQDVVEAEERREEREREKREAQQRSNEARAAENHTSDSSPVITSTEEPEVELPSPQEQQASAAAYQESNRAVDAQIEKEMRKQGQPHRPQDFEITFDKFVASLYMTSLMQLGLAAPQGAKPEVDLLGARQTIDTLAMLQEKTKGNLTAAEANVLQNCLYELRMAYLEVTNLITRPPQAGAGADGKA